MSETQHPYAALCGKLSNARRQLHAQKLTKTGENKFAGYSYFELADFLPATLKAFEDHGLFGIVTFAQDHAALRIVDLDTGLETQITSPLSEANLKGCHPVQNLGAVETYQRRYLWATAMELIESDPVDAAKPADKPASAERIKAAFKGDKAKAEPSETTVWETAVSDVNEKTGVNKKGEPWTLTQLFFENGKKASTFGHVPEVHVGDEVQVTVKPGYKPGYFDIVEINVNEDRDGEGEAGGDEPY